MTVDWITIQATLTPVLMALGGAIGVLLGHRAALRNADSAKLAAAAAAHKAAVDEMSEVRQSWALTVANLTSDNSALRAENVAIRATCALLESQLTAQKAKYDMDMQRINTALLECETLNREFAKRLTELEAAIVTPPTGSV